MDTIKNLNIKLLINLGAHIGHAKIDWNSNNKAYLAGLTNNKHIIFNINKTLFFFKRALTFLRLVGYNGGKFVIYFPGEDPFYKSMMEAVLDREGLLPSKYPFIHSFVKPGFFSNWRTNYKQFVKKFFKIIFWNPYFFSALATQLFYQKLDTNTLLNNKNKHLSLDRLSYLVKLKKNKTNYYQEAIRNLRIFRKVKRTNFRHYAKPYRFPRALMDNKGKSTLIGTQSSKSKSYCTDVAYHPVDLHFFHKLDYIFLHMSNLRIVDFTSYSSYTNLSLKINYNSIRSQRYRSSESIGLNKYRSIDSDFWFSKVLNRTPPFLKKVFMLYSFNNDSFLPSIYKSIHPIKLFNLVKLLDKLKITNRNQKIVRLLKKYVHKLFYKFNVQAFCKEYLHLLYLKSTEQQIKLGGSNKGKFTLQRKARQYRYKLPLIGSFNEFTTRGIIRSQLSMAKSTKLHPKYTANKINAMIYSYISKMSREHKKSSIITPSQIVRTDAFKMLYYNIYNLLVNIAMHNHKYNSKRDTLSPQQQLMFRRFIRFTVIFRYLKRLMKIPSAVILLNSDVHESQYSDFQNLNAAVIGLLDSNISFRSLSYFIPTNDDSIVLFLYYVKMFGYSYSSGYKSRFLDLLIPKLVVNATHEDTYPNFFLNYGSQFKDHAIHNRLTKSPNPLRNSYDLLTSASNISDFNHLQKIDLREKEKQKAREEYFKWKDSIRSLKQRMYSPSSTKPYTKARGKLLVYRQANKTRFSPIGFRTNNKPNTFHKSAFDLNHYNNTNYYKSKSLITRTRKNLNNRAGDNRHTR